MKKYAVIGITMVAAIVMIMSTTLSVTDSFAAKNEWGKLASDLARSEPGKMGSHSSDPIQGDDDRETPRTGVGNLDLDEGDGDIDDDGGDRDHPSETADILRDLCESGQGSEDQCP
jgi:hypothetical protein